MMTEIYCCSSWWLTAQALAILHPFVARLHDASYLICSTVLICQPDFPTYPPTPIPIPTPTPTTSGLSLSLSLSFSLSFSRVRT